MRFSSALTVFPITLIAWLSACSPRPLHILEHQDQQYTIIQQQASDSSMVSMLKPYKNGVDTQMQVVIGHTDIPLTKAQPESTLGNFLADATLVAGQQLDRKVVAALENYGGIRLPYIAPGAITRGKIYELMPFDNMLTIIEIPGSDLQTLCDGIAQRKGWPISGISFSIKDQKAINVLVAGKPLVSSLVYKIAVNDYIARGGDNCDVLISLKKRNTTVFLRDAMITYLTNLEHDGKPLHPVLDKRIQYAE